MKKKWIIPLIIGVVVVSIGLILLISGLRTSVPEEVPFGKPGWFESASESSSARFRKGAFIGFGVFVIFAGIVISSSIYFTSTRMSMAKSKVGEVQETIIKEFFQVPVPQVAEEKPKEKEAIYCDYCGAKLDENDKKCPGCGSVITKRNKKE